MSEHRNVIKKKFCPGCDHFHGVHFTNVPNATGMCLKDPPTLQVLGMAQTATSVIRGDKVPTDLAPVLRAYYPPVGPGDTCSQWTPRAEGEA